MVKDRGNSGGGGGGGKGLGGGGCGNLWDLPFNLLRLFPVGRSLQTVAGRRWCWLRAAVRIRPATKSIEVFFPTSPCASRSTAAAVSL